MLNKALLTLAIFILLQGCSTLRTQSAVIEIKQNKFYAELTTSTSVLDTKEAKNKIIPVMKTFCSDGKIKNIELFNGRHKARLPGVRCFTRACDSSQMITATILCNEISNKKINLTKDHITLDLSKEKDRLEFEDYAIGTYKGVDSYSREALRDFGYPDTVHFDGYKSAYWIYKRKGGELLFEFTGGPLVTGYKYTGLHISLVKGVHIKDIELKKLSQQRFKPSINRSPHTEVENNEE